MEEMRNGVGLDFATLINTHVFEEIHLHLLHSGSEQTFEKLMAKNPNLDLSCLDDDNESMKDAEAKTKTVEEAKGLKKVDGMST